MTACTALELQTTHYRTEEEYYRAMYRKQVEYQARIAPFLRVRAELAAVMPIRLIVGKDGKVISSGIDWAGCEEAKKAYDQCQEMIESIAREYTGGCNDGKK